MRPKREKKKRGGFFLALFLLAAGFTGGMGAAGALAVYFSELPLPLITPPTRDGDQDIAKLRERECRETLKFGETSGLRLNRECRETSESKEDFEFHDRLRQKPPVAANSPNDFGLQPVGPDFENQPAADAAPDAENAQPEAAPETAAIAKPAKRVFIYHLQVAAFRDRAAADALHGEIALEGFEASVRPDNPDDPKIWRVRLGPFDDELQVEEQRALLGLKGYNDVSVQKSIDRNR